MLFKQVVGLVAIAFALALGACSSPTSTPTLVLPTAIPTTQPSTAQPSASSAATRTPASTPTPNPKDPLLAALSSALAKIKTYRARVPEEGRVMEVVLPDRIHQEGSEITKIGPLFYQNDLNDTLQVRQMGAIPFMDRVNLLWFRDQVSKSSGTSALGPATIDGTQCIGYSTSFGLLKINPPSTPGATPVVTQLTEQVKVWFAITDGFPRRIEYGAPISVTVNFYDYNASIEINPPSP